MFHLLRPLRIACAATLLLPFLAAGGSAEEPILLRWKLAEGQKFDVGLTQTADMTMSVEGETVKTSQTIRVDMGWTVDSAEAAGGIQLTQVTNRIRMEMTLPGGERPVKYDSNDEEGEDGEGVAAFFGAMIKPLRNAKFVQTMDDRGRVKEITLDKAGENAPPERSGNMPGAGFTPEDLKMINVKMTAEFPEDAVRPGAEWSHGMNLGVPGTSARAKVDSVYHGLEERDGRKLARIDMTFRLETQEASTDPKKEEEADDAAPRIDLTEYRGTGRIFFDHEAGLLVESESTVDMVMEIRVMGHTVPTTAKTRLRATVEPAK